MEDSTPPPLPPQRQPPPSVHRTYKRRALFQITKVRHYNIIGQRYPSVAAAASRLPVTIHTRTMPPPPAILNAIDFFSAIDTYFAHLFSISFYPSTQVFALVPVRFTKYGRLYYCYYVNTTTAELHLFYSKQSWLLSRLSKQPDIIIVPHRASSYSY